MKTVLLGVVAAGLLAFAPAAHAATVDFTFTSPTGDLGSFTHTYTISGISITADGHTGSVGSTTTVTGNVNLFGKNAGGDESGLGLGNDPSGDHEITKGSYIELVMPTGLSAVSLEMGSSTSPDAWAVWGCTSALSGCTQLVAGTDELTFHSLALDPYYVITETTTGGNVLLGQMDVTMSATPLPGAALLLIGPLGGLIWGARRKKNGVSALGHA
jgi:hypothetical protein